jgi:hypothetical protein
MSSKSVRTVFNEADGTLVGPLRSPRQRLPNRSMAIALRSMTIRPRKIKTQVTSLYTKLMTSRAFHAAFFFPATGRAAVSHSQSGADCMIILVQGALSDRDRAVLSELRRQSNGGER